MSIKCGFFFIIIFIIKLIRNSEIIIPFTSLLSQIPKNLTPTDFMKSLVKNEILTNIKLGTPPQSLDVVVDFKNYHSYIIQDKENDNERFKRFYNNSSTTFQNLGKNEYFHLSDFTYANNSSDIITINENISNFNFIFLQITTSNADTKIEYPGILGFGVVPNTNPFHFEAGLIYQLKNNNLINNHEYTLVFNNNDDFNGKIIIEKNIYEEYSLDNFYSDYCLTTIDYYFYWGWNHITTKFNSELLEIKNAFLKPELGIILMSTEIKNVLKEKFFDEKIKEGKCYEGYEYYTFYYCDKDVKMKKNEFKFEFQNKNVLFSLNFEDLIMEYNNKIFFLLGFGFKIAKEEIYLGYPFFRKYDVIFNQDKRTAGFYNFKLGKNKKDVDENKSENNKQDNNKNVILLKKILIIILVIFCIFLFIYIIFYIYRTIKRKEKSKLLEDLNNMENV